MSDIDELKDDLSRYKKEYTNKLQKVKNNEEKLNSNEQLMAHYLSQLMGKQYESEAQVRTKIADRLDRLSDQQTVNNDFLAELSSNLNDMSDLKAIYETKRNIMEQNYQELLKELETQRNTVLEQLSDMKEGKTLLEKQLHQITIRKKFITLKNNIIVGSIFLALVFIIASILGFGIVDSFRWLWDWIKKINL